MTKKLEVVLRGDNCWAFEFDDSKVELSDVLVDYVNEQQTFTEDVLKKQAKAMNPIAKDVIKSIRAILKDESDTKEAKVDKIAKELRTYMITTRAFPVFQVSSSKLDSSKQKVQDELLAQLSELEVDEYIPKLVKNVLSHSYADTKFILKDNYVRLNTDNILDIEVGFQNFLKYVEDKGIKVLGQIDCLKVGGLN